MNTDALSHETMTRGNIPGRQTDGVELPSAGGTGQNRKMVESVGVLGTPPKATALTVFAKST